MRKFTAAGLCTLALGVALTGCGTKAETASETAPTGSATHTTIADYVDENKFVQSAVTKGQPGAPVVHFAMPPGWKSAGARTPEWAYGAIIYADAQDQNDPPFVTAVYNKLTGEVEPAKILEYAPGLLQNLPGYTQDGDLQRSTLGGFDAVQFQGSYLRDDKRRYIAQQTVVIPGNDDAWYVLQLNADAPLGQDQVILEAGKVIDQGTTVTP